MTSRRSYLKGLAAAGGASAVGGIGLLSMGSAMGAEGDFELSGPAAVTTDDGSIQYTAFGGQLRFEWDGLDQEATYGYISGRSRLVRNESGLTGWQDHAVASGPLGDEESADGHDGDGAFEDGEGNSPNSWGGLNDTNSGPGTSGTFQFNFGRHHGSADYCVAANDDVQGNYGDYGPNGLIPATGGEVFPASRFEATTDGGSQATTVQVEKVLAVYAGDPTGDGVELIRSTDRATYRVTVNNEEATATAGGNGSGFVGANTE